MWNSQHRITGPSGLWYLTAWGCGVLNHQNFSYCPKELDSVTRSYANVKGIQKQPDNFEEIFQQKAYLG